MSSPFLPARHRYLIALPIENPEPRPRDSMTSMHSNLSDW